MGIAPADAPELSRLRPRTGSLWARKISRQIRRAHREWLLRASTRST
jgi:hypothetical protein